MFVIDPWELFLWTFRRNEQDVINLYDSLSDVMRLATGGDMLNFGYWSSTTQSPLDAQTNLCYEFSKYARLGEGQNIVDVGSGFSAPAFYWAQKIGNMQITCINTNSQQLSYSVQREIKSVSFVNSSATRLPLCDSSFDRVLALESSQHFRPIEKFFSESYRVLKKNGMLVLALPVLSNELIFPLSKLGLVALTWSSEHYAFSQIHDKLLQNRFEILDYKKIGQFVYPPLADYYFKNRQAIKEKITTKYPKYVESILAKSIEKMDSLSKNNTIDYVLLACKPIGK